MKLASDVLTSSASFSPCGQYRYTLGRWWETTGQGVLWIMLNPSTATEDEDDPTIRRCQGFARRWSYVGIEVVNLFALRATDPTELTRHLDPIGPDNKRLIQQAMNDRRIGLIVAAWGTGWEKVDRPRLAVESFAKAAGCELRCLGVTKAGHPRHPLYLRNDAVLMPWPNGVHP